MKKAFICIIFIIFLSCVYENPFKKYDGKNLISKLDLTNDWIIESGVLLDATTEPPPSGYSTSYYFYFINLLDDKSSNFETSTGGNDTGNWQPSLDNGTVSSKPDTLEVRSNPTLKLEGNKSLYIKLTNNPYPQYVYYEFSPDLSTDYIFKFDYYNSVATTIGLSFGLSSNNLDNQIYFISTASDVKNSFVVNFSSIEANLSQIRFGFKENKNWESGIDIYIDRIALFKSSNLSISKFLNIVESNDRTNDGTGEEFYEGKYRFCIYAKKDTSSFLTLRIGTAIKTFTLTDKWIKYSLESQILRTEGFIKLEIMPTSINNFYRFPGGIFITKPELYLIY